MLTGDFIAMITRKVGIEPCPACMERKKFLNQLHVNFTRRMRVAEDGSIIYPQRGKAPEPPEGYEVDPKNQYRHILKIADCPHRQNVITDTSCCKNWETLACTKYNTRTDRLNCRNCMYHNGHKDD